MTRSRVPLTPPHRDGLSASRVTVGEGPWRTVGEFLTAHFPQVQDWQQRLQRGAVLAADGESLQSDSPCQPGSLLWYWRQPPPEQRVPFEIEVLYQDQHLVAVDKPHFLPVTPAGRYLEETVLVRLQRLLGIQSLAPMHRLDLETAGVVLFTVVPATRSAYQSLLRERRVRRVYEAIAPYPEHLTFPRWEQCRIQERPGAEFMQMQVVEGEPNAHTWIEIIAGQSGSIAHYRLIPRTGRKHQLRIQLSTLGIPILGDRIYPELKPAFVVGDEPDYSQPLQLLAREVSFIDPITGEPRRFTSRRQLQALPGPDRQ